MLKGMPRQNRMSLLNIDLNLVFQTKVLQKPIDRSNIVIILMLCWLLRLGLYQNSAFEANFMFILDHHL